MPSSHILRLRVDPTSYAAATAQILDWSREATGRTVCVANVHLAMEAYDSPGFRAAANGADLVTPDGVPLVWALRRLGHKQATRVYGPDLTVWVLDAAARAGVPVGFYGGQPRVLEQLQAAVRARWPALRVAYAWSPPFRPLNPEQDARCVAEINASGARILFLGLGCPKQEFWMAEHKDRVHTVMLGVGAAFDFLAGSKPQAPRWMMRVGLEWFHRLVTEPRRLWWRYCYHNPRFMFLFALQLAGLLRPPEPLSPAAPPRSGRAPP